MQLEDPPWKIRTRPCPFYSQGKCFFAKNCSFLHQVKSSPTVIRVTAPDDSHTDLNDPDSTTTVPAKLPHAASPGGLPDGISLSLSGHSGPYTDKDDSESDGDEEETSDLDSPTIRKPVLTSTINTRESGPSRDSVATIKGGSHGPETAKRVSLSYSLPHYHRREASTFSTLSLSTSPRTASDKIGSSFSPLPESLSDTSLSRTHTPTSATSATAQEVEVPVLGGPLRLITPFTLADAGGSSLLANRLAKSRRPTSSSPPAPVLTPVADPSTPFSAGALYASYQQEESAFEPAFLPVRDTVSDTVSPEGLSSTPHTAPKTPTWLKPLRLASALTPQTGSRSPSSTSNREHGAHDSRSQSISSMSSFSSVSPGPTYESPVARISPTELYRRSSFSSQNIPTNTPHTIVLSDHDGFVSPLALSRSGSLDIDMTHFPPPPASSGTSVHNSSSSTASITLSELIGHSSKAKPSEVTRTREALSGNIIPRVNTPVSLERATTPAEQFRSAIERRTQKIRESSRRLASTDLHQILPNPSLPAPDSRGLLSDLTVSTSVSHSRSLSSTSDIPVSNSWELLPPIDMLSKALPHSSASDSLLFQAQSSPPRTPPCSRTNLSAERSISPLSSGPVINHTPSHNPSPRPQLLFAIASDQPAEVERLLSTGKASANETTGGGTGLLEFTVTNEALKNKTEIVKTLLKYGADPESLKHDAAGEDSNEMDGSRQSPAMMKKVEEGMNPAMKYYLARPQSLDIDSKPALEALQQSSFAPLARARFDIIGQDRALDELYRVLGMYSQRKGRNALVILLCGASGHGKSLLAQKVGALLNAPTHTINMTALRSQHDLWQCLSTGMDDASPHLDLSEFLIENQGKRCVVVLDEIEKVDDPKSLNPLLLPWDIGRCSLEQKKHTDTSQVVWIATSNLGQKIISEHVAQWGHPDSPPDRVEYTQLATAVRRRIAEVLGASLLSRVTTILPFLPFTEVEKIAIGTEAALSHQEFTSAQLTGAQIEAIVRRAVKDINFVEEEGARSLHRVVEIHMTRA